MGRNSSDPVQEAKASSPAKGVILKIVIACDTYAPDINGASTFASDLAAGLSNRGHQVHVIAPSPIGQPYRETKDNVHEHRMRSHEYPFFKGFYICFPWEIEATIRKILRELKPDVVHTQSHFMVGRYACKWANRLQIPLVATNHFMPENLVNHLPLPHFLMKGVSSLAWLDVGHVYKLADRLTAPTPSAVELVRKRAELGGVIPVSCGIDIDKYRRAAQKATPNAVVHMLSVGRLEKEKHLNEVIEALTLLQPSTPLHFDIVGEGSELEALRQLAADLQVLDRVTFHGFLPRKELVNMFGQTDFFVNASIAELQSIVTLEALSAGKPVILANAVALPHLVHHGVNGYLFQPGDVEQLSAYIEELALNPARRKFMGKASLDLVEPHSFGNTLDILEKIYESAIQDREKCQLDINPLFPKFSHTRKFS